MFSKFRSSFFGSNNPLTRFQKSSEFAQTLTLLKELHDKNNELEKAAAKEGVNSIAFPKHKVVSQVVGILNTKISDFNDDLPSTHQMDEQLDILQLADDLIEATLPVLAANQGILFQPRDNNRKLANITFELLAIGGTVTTAALVAPMPFIVVPIAFIGSSVVSHYTREAVGLNNIAPRSACILFDLISQIILIGKTVSEKLGLNTKKYDTYIAEVINICEEAIHHYLKQQDPSFKQEKAELLLEENTPAANSVHEFLYYSRSLQDFIRWLAKKDKFSDSIKKLNLTAEEKSTLFAGFYDPTTGEIMNTPVRINGRLADLDATFKYPLDDKGRRQDPFSPDYIFYPIELQPDWQAANAIEEKINSIMVLREEIVPETMRPR